MRVAALAVCFLLSLACSGRAQTTFLFDHIHLDVPDIPAAASWYEKNFDGKRLAEGPDRLTFGTIRLLFIKKADAKPSAGGAVDHIGFSVPDIDAKMKELAAAGVKIRMPARDVPGLPRLGFIEDPWGTNIEIVQDEALLGLHHVHLIAPDPDEVFSWLQANFGGKKTMYRNKLEAIRYPGGASSSIWVLVQKGNSEPSAGRALDHIGWRSEGPIKTALDEMKGRGVQVTSGPGTFRLPNGPPFSFALVAGPAGITIEITERPGE